MGTEPARGGLGRAGMWYLVCVDCGMHTNQPPTAQLRSAPITQSKGMAHPTAYQEQQEDRREEEEPITRCPHKSDGQTGNTSRILLLGNSLEADRQAAWISEDMFWPDSGMSLFQTDLSEKAG